MDSKLIKRKWAPGKKLINDYDEFMLMIADHLKLTGIQRFHFLEMCDLLTVKGDGLRILANRSVEASDRIIRNIIMP